MKKGKFLVLGLSLFTVLAVSCGSDPDNKAKSTHVDSTNVNGTAPVQYGADNPADTTARYQNSDDTGRRSNTGERQSQ